MKCNLSVLLAFAACAAGSAASAQIANAPIPAGTAATTETIVILRHGEKTTDELGQLDPQGLNRANALPPVMRKLFGRPDYIYAPDPGKQITNRSTGAKYSYVRPLETIAPTAITLGMPINAEYGFKDIAGLENEITGPSFSSSLVYVCWEHLKANDLAKNILKDNNGNPSQVPDWPNDDYDRLYVIRIVRAPAASGGKSKNNATATVTEEFEGLNGEPVVYTPPAPPMSMPMSPTASPAAPASGPSATGPASPS